MKRLILLAVLLAGCRSAQPDSGKSFAGGSKFSCSIESDPPGARVFWSAGANVAAADHVRNYIGSTPCVWEGDCEPDHTFKPINYVGFYNRAVKAAVILTAEPPAGATNLWPQRQVFRCGAAFQHGDQVPTKLFFDMGKRP